MLSQSLPEVEDGDVAVGGPGGELQQVRVEGQAADGAGAVAQKALLVLQHVQLGTVRKQGVDGHVLRRKGGNRMNNRQ